MSVAETMKAITDCAKKLIEAPRYNVGDFVGVYDYETAVRIYDIRWEGSCFVYKVYLADEETWLYDEDIAYKKDEMIEGLVEEETIHNKWTGLKVELELSKTVIGVSNVESLRGERFMSGFVKAIIPPEGYIFEDENGNVINATKIVLKKKDTM